LIINKKCGKIYLKIRKSNKPKGEIKMTNQEILKSSESFRYQLLSRLQSDCNYYLGNGNRHKKHLWAEDETEQIITMKQLWNSFSSEDKPEWLTWEDILNYENKMMN
jgi:hypothetical protein